MEEPPKTSYQNMCPNIFNSKMPKKPRSLLSLSLHRDKYYDLLIFPSRTCRRAICPTKKQTFTIFFTYK